MTRRCLLGLAAAALSAQDESFEVYRDHPRVLLTPDRLRRLRKDRERRTERWQQFETLIRGGARMPEAGFAQALYFQVTGDEAAAKRAVAGASDLRQMALVYDWCQPHSAELKPKLEAALKRPPAGGVAEARSRALAAVAVGNAAELERLVRKWWRGGILPALKAGGNAVAREDLYALFELLHAVRDNTSIDLREGFAPWFLRLPSLQLLSYYPAIYPAPENDYRIPAIKGAVPDLEGATLSRAAEMAIVAYDNNLRENQYLQGWAMHDRFILRGALGVPYEFLWANPYQPGLSYDLLPAHCYDPIQGQVFARSNWDDGAEWLGWFEGELQTFSNGEPRVAPVEGVRQFRGAVVIAATAPGRWEVAEDATHVYLVGLPPRRVFKVEPADREMHEQRTDPGGVLALEFPTGFRGGLTIR
jgi:hypothetical protein